MEAVESGTGNAFERFFKFKQWDTSLRRDTLAGLTTFIVMSYIIFVNPSHPRPRRQGSAVRGGSHLHLPGRRRDDHPHGAWSRNRAYAIAPGLGLNAVVAFSLVLGQGLTFPQAMGLIVLEGVAITILVLTGFREAIFKAIPLELKKAIVVGIGFFILFIGLVDGGIVDGRHGGGHRWPRDRSRRCPVAVTIFGLVVTIIMLTRRWRGADHPRHRLRDDLRDRSSTTPTTRTSFATAGTP